MSDIKRGRPSSYSDEIAAEVCARLAAGEPLSQICRSEHMPPRTTVLDWVLNDREGFSDRYARARELCLEAWADDIVEVSDNATNDWMKREGKADSEAWILNGEHVNRSRLRVDSRKWMLSRLNPDKYGDRVKNEHTGKDGAALFPALKVTFDPVHGG